MIQGVSTLGISCCGVAEFPYDISSPELTYPDIINVMLSVKRGVCVFVQTLNTPTAQFRRLQSLHDKLVADGATIHGMSDTVRNGDVFSRFLYVGMYSQYTHREGSGKRQEVLKKAECRKPLEELWDKLCLKELHIFKYIGKKVQFVYDGTLWYGGRVKCQLDITGYIVKSSQANALAIFVPTNVVPLNKEMQEKKMVGYFLGNYMNTMSIDYANKDKELKALPEKIFTAGIGYVPYYSLHKSSVDLIGVMFNKLKVLN